MVEGGGGVRTQIKNKDERAICQRNSRAFSTVGGRRDGVGGGGRQTKRLINHC